MDELYAFLFAGLFILLMLFVFFGGTPYEPINGYVNGGDNVTPSGNLTWKIIDLGDISISEQNLKKKETLSEEYEVFNGLFFGKKSYKAKYEVDEKILNNLEGATLTYFVEDTNKYGELKVKFNNETLYSGEQIIGKCEYDVEPGKENLIEIETTSSGWRIWAPSTYLISNISMNLNYKLKEYPEHEFLVSNYIHKNLKKSELLFRFVGGDDELKVELNNQTIYQGIPETEHNVVEVLSIKGGENKIVFSSEGEVELEDVLVRLYYYK